MRDPLEIMSAYFDDSLGEGEREELRAWLAADPERLRQFVIESVIHSRLSDVLVQRDMQGLVVGDLIDPQHVASLLDEEEAASARRAREAAEQVRLAELAAARQEELLDRKVLRIEEPPTPKWPVYAGVAVAAALLLIVGRLTGPAPELASTRHAAPALAEPPIVAELTRTFDAAVNSEIGPLASGARLHPGVLRFDRGVVELKFASGAKLVVEAPAELQLMSADRAKLISGRAVAHVPQEALGFTLHSQAAAFVDLGTEFGVEIADGGEASIHVLDGEVALVSDKKEGATPSRTLQRGVANEVNADGSVRDIPFDESRFLRRVPNSPYELAVLKSRPLAYWRLDQSEANAKIISEGRLALTAFVNAGLKSADNRARGGAEGGPARAALFAGEHDGIDVTADAALGAVSNCTCEAWVLPDASVTGPQRIFSTFDRPRSGWAIGVVDGRWYRLPNDDLSFHLTVYGDYDVISARPVAAGEWVHLAASIDAEGTPRLYVNGATAQRRFRPLGVVGGDAAIDDQPRTWEAEMPTPLGRATAGPARIGRNPVGADGQISPERWLGQISNVAVYDRVLTAEEIRQHFKAIHSTLTLQGANGGN